MNRDDAPFEIHVHGDVKLRTDVGFDALQDALKPLWKYAGARSLADGAASLYEDEPGIRFDPRVDIDKNQPQPRRQQAADMALARAHRADQDDVAAVGGGMAHRNMLAAAAGPAAMTARN